jgi:hypothetical protein
VPGSQEQATNSNFNNWVNDLSLAELRNLVGRFKSGDPPFNGELPADHVSLSQCVPVLAAWRRDGFS